MKIILIGRGSSVLRSTRQFVEEHDLICIVNKLIFTGYEKYVGNNADIQFRNGTCGLYSEKEIKTLKLKKIIYTHTNNKFPSYPQHYKGIEIITPKPPIKNKINEIMYGLDPSSGISGLYYILTKYDVDLLSIVGFDYYELNQPPYYFKPKEADNELKYLWNKKYKNNIINVKSGHDTDKSIEFTKIMINQYPDIHFNLMTNSTMFYDFNPKNINYL
ncbi:MAG: hypothetical protein ACOC2W_01540 [bacterium]